MSLPMTSFRVMVAVIGRPGGWPGQPTWIDPTMAYIASPYTYNYGPPVGSITYQIPDPVPLPSNPNNQPVYITLQDVRRDGRPALYADLSPSRFNNPAFVPIGVVMPGMSVVDWVNPTFGPSGAGHSPGVVPDPGSTPGTTRFLCEDATFKVPSSGGGAVTSVFGRTGVVVATSGDYSVGQVTGAAPSASPTFTGVAAAPTPTTGDNSTKIATTAFVNAEITANSPVTSVAGRTGAIVLGEGDITNLTSDLAAKAPLVSPALTGTPTVPTAVVDTNTTQAASTAFVLGQGSASGDGTPAMDGTASRGSSTHFARADHVHPTDTSRQATLSFPLSPGQISSGVNHQTGAYTIVDGDRGKLLVITGDPFGNTTVILPDPGTGGGFGAGWFVDIQNDQTFHVGSSTNNVSISNGEIDFFFLKAGDGMRIFCDGSAYWSQRGITNLVGMASSPHIFLTGINQHGLVEVAQPAYSDLSGVISLANLFAQDQGTTLGPTTLLTVGAGSGPVAAGFYEVSFYAGTSTAGTGTTATVSVTWTDRGGAKTFTSGTFALTSTAIGGEVNGVIAIKCASSTVVQVSVTVGLIGTSLYDYEFAIRQIR